MQLHFSGLWVLLTLLKVNPALWKFIRLTFTSYTDVDECKDESHDCHVNGTCTNTAGSFECVCNDGYFGNGRNCSGSHPDPKIRRAGWSPSKNKVEAPPPGPFPWIRHWAQTPISTDQIIDTGQSHRWVKWIGDKQIDVLPFICSCMLTRLGQLNRII